MLMRYASAIAFSAMAIACSSVKRTIDLKPMAKAKAEAETEPGTKPAIYLLDSMSFIFRAYHAMQRQRPMSTRKGVPTAATYVFINMLRKLLADFSPQYVGAVYDV